MKKKIGLISLLMAGTAAIALTSCSNNDAQVKQNEDNISSVQKDVKTLKESLTQAQTTLDEYMATINNYLKVDKISTNGDVIASLEKKISDLTTSTATALDAKVKELEGKLTALETSTKAALDAATGELIKDAEEKVVPIQTQINEINDDITALGTEDAKLQAAIDAVNAAMGELIKEDDKVVPLQDQINKINTNIDELDLALVLVDAELTNLGNADTELQGKITGVSNDLAAYKTEVNDTYAKLADLAKLEGDLTTLINNTKTELETTINTNKTNAEKAIAEANAAITTAKNDLTTLINNTKTTLEQSIATKAVKADVDKAFADAAKDLKDFKDEVEATYATIEKLAEVENDLKTNYVTKEVYEAAIKELKEFIGTIKTNEETQKVISLQDQIDDLEKAKATVEALEELGKTVTANKEAFDAKIADLAAKIGEIKTEKNDEDEDQIVPLQIQINALVAQIGNVTEVDETTGEIISLQDQINAIKAQIGDFSGTKELTKAKAELNKKLSNVYADFQDRIEDARAELVDTYHVDVEDLFREISRSFNHEMTGYLYEGMTYITLANNEAEAKAYEEEYELLIGNYINPAMFEISKQMDLHIIKDASRLEYIGELDYDEDPEGLPAEGTIRAKYYYEVLGVEWFTDDEVEALKLTPAIYKEETEKLISKMQLATNKAETINAFLEAYSDEVNSINNNFEDPEKYKDELAPEEFIALLDAIKNYDEDNTTLAQYDKCTNEIVKYTDPDTGKTTEITDLYYQYLQDIEKIKLVHQEQIDYLSVNKFASDVYADILDTLPNLSDDDLENIEDAIYEVIDLENYAFLTVVDEVEEIDPETSEPIVKEVERYRTIAESQAQLTADKEDILEIYDQAVSYDTLLGYAAKAIGTIKNLENITKPATPADGKSEEEKIIALINKVINIKNYIGNDGTVEVGGVETELHEAQLKADKEAIALIVDQATKYDEVRGYANDRNIVKLGEDNYGIKYGNLAIPANEISEEDRKAINILINAVPDYDNYINNNTIDDETGTYVYLDTYTADKAKLDKYEAGVGGYNSILLYSAMQGSAVEGIFNEYETQLVGVEPDQYEAEVEVTPEEKKTERNTIIGLIGKIPAFANYFGEDAIEVGKQFESDKAAADLLVTRAEVFDKIYDAINDDADGLVAYIDSLESKYDDDNDPLTEPTKGQFTAELKNKFKAQFTDYALAATYDAEIANFKTEKEFDDYLDTITGTDGILKVVEKRADVYCYVLKTVNEAEDDLNDEDEFYMFVGSYDDYNELFIKNFIHFQEYDVYMKAIAGLTTSQIETWKTSNTQALENIFKVAEYENTLLAKVDEVKTAIQAALAEKKLSEAENDYLLGVTDSIYEEYKSVFRADPKAEEGTPESKDRTLTVVSKNAFNAPKAELNAVKSAITTIYNVDTAAKTLADNISTYITDQRTQFFKKYYKYKDDKDFGAENYYYDDLTQTASGKYGFYNQAALEAWKFYEADLADKANGNKEKEIVAVNYTYTLPTEYDYDKFAEFINKLETPTTISARYNTYTDWFSATDTGMVYTITAKYRALDAAKLDGARTYFKAELLKAYNDALSKTSLQTYKNDLKTDYDICVDNINDAYGATTTRIIDYYVDTLAKFEVTVSADAAAYKDSKIADYNAIYSAYQTAITDDDTTLTKLATTHNAGLEAINAKESKADVDTEYAAQVTELTIIYREYVTNKLQTVGGSLTEKDPYVISDQTHAQKYLDAYNAFTETLKDADKIEKADIDTAFDTAVAAFVAVYKEAKLAELTALCDEYKLIDKDNTDVNAAYQTICGTYLDLIEAATTDADIDENYDLGAGELLATYAGIVKTAVTAEAAKYTAGLDETEDADLIAAYENVITAAINAIDAVTDPTKYADVTAVFGNAADAFLGLYKAVLVTKLGSECNDYEAYDEASKDKYEAVYGAGGTAIFDAETKDAAKTEYDTAAAKFLPIFKDSATSQLNALNTSYKAKDADNAENYEDILEAGLEAIGDAETNVAVDAAITTAKEAMFDIYQAYIDGELDSLYTADAALIGFDGMDAVLEAVYNDAKTAIEAATEEADVTATYDAAVDEMALIVYKDGKLTSLNTVYVQTYGETPATNVTTEYNKGVAAIKAAKTTTDVDTAAADAVAQMAAVDLANYKTSKTKALKTASDAGAVANQTFVAEYNAAYAAGAAAIDLATKKEDVTSIYDDYYDSIINLVDNYKNNLKTTGENSLKAKYDTLKVTEGAQDDELLDLGQAYSDGKDAIDSATTKTAIDTAYSDALAEMDACIKNLANYKIAKKGDLEEYFNLQTATLSQVGKTEVRNTALNPGKTKIDATETKADAYAEYTATLNAIDAAIELFNYKTEMKGQLELYYNTNYSVDEQTAAATAYSAGITAIGSATTIDDVTTAYNGAVAAMELAVVKNTWLGNLKEAYAVYGENPAENVTTEYDNGKTAIQAAEDEDGVITAYNAAVNAMLYEYVLIKVNAFDGAFENYNSEAGATEKTALETAHNNWRVTIDQAISKSDADSKYESGIAAMEACLATLADYITARKADLTAYYGTITSSEAWADYSTDQKNDIIAEYNGGLTAIDMAANKPNADSALKNAKTEIDSVKAAVAAELLSYKFDKTTALNEYWNNIDKTGFTNQNKTDLEALYQDGYNAIGQAQAKAAVDTAYADAKAAMDAFVATVISEMSLPLYKERMNKALLIYYNNTYNSSSTYVRNALENSNVLDSGLNEIDGAADKADVDTAYANAKSAIDAVIELAEYKDKKLANLFSEYDKVYDQLVATYENRLSDLNTIYGNGQTAINDASNESDVNTAYGDCVEAMWNLTL